MSAKCAGCGCDITRGTYCGGIYCLAKWRGWRGPEPKPAAASEPAPPAAENQQVYGYQPRPAGTAIERALQLLVLTRETREYLKAHDPKALQQACRALGEAGLQYLVRQPADGDVPSDVCWYCYGVLEASGVCRECTDRGQQLPSEVWGGDPPDVEQATAYERERAEERREREERED